MPSFDMVSEVEISEVRNTVENSTRVLDTRFDFRGVEASFELSGENVVVKAEGDFQLKQMIDILRNQCVKRNIDPNSMNTDAKVERTGKTHAQTVSFMQGIEQSLAKKIVKMIKDQKMKVQASIQGEKVRVTGKKRDDLQQVMAFIRAADLEQPIQFDNFRD